MQNAQGQDSAQETRGQYYVLLENGAAINALVVSRVIICALPLRSPNLFFSPRYLFLTPNIPRTESQP